MRIVRGGQIDREMLDLILLNVRTPQEREGDLAAQIGACRVGEQRNLGIVAKYGEDRLRALTGELLDYPSGWCAPNCGACQPANSLPKTGSMMMASMTSQSSCAFNLN